MGIAHLQVHVHRYIHSELDSSCLSVDLNWMNIAASGYIVHAYVQHKVQHVNTVANTASGEALTGYIHKDTVQNSEEKEC